MLLRVKAWLQSIFCKNVTESVSEKVTSREAIASKKKFQVVVVMSEQVMVLDLYVALHNC